VLKEGFARHSIATSVYSESATKPTGCEYVLTYTARQSWDFAPYLSQAELWLEKDGREIGYAEYHLVGKGGLSLMKWEGTKTKMDPVIDDLLVNVSHAAKPQETQQAESTEAEAGR